MKKIYISILLVILIIFIIGGCASNNETPNPNDTKTIFTLEELSEYNGANGNPAYIAVDGVVYDVTDVGPWANGEHNGFQAGNDLSDEIKKSSPHGVSKLDGLQVVGRLAD